MDLPIWWMASDYPRKLVTARSLYWDSDMTAKQILETVGITDVRPSDMPRLVGARTVQIPCVDCGDLQPVVVESRADEEAARSGNTWRNKKRRSAGQIRCESCLLDLLSRIARDQEDRQRAAKDEDRIREELRSMPYAEYLKTDHWQAIRKEALRRAGYRCAVCNAQNETLDAHHRTYVNRGSERSGDVIALCRTCHGRFHGVSE